MEQATANAIWSGHTYVECSGGRIYGIPSRLHIFRNRIWAGLVLHDNEQLFAAKYMTYMPTEEELRREIEQQKQFFLEQQNKKV